MAPAAATPFTLSVKAHNKALCHAAKFPWAGVTGFLLAEAGSNRIVDATPLFHTPALAPMLEVAAMLVEEHCKANGLRIVGLYAAEDNADASSPSPLVERVASQLAAKNKNSCLLLVDNAALASEDKPAFLLYTQASAAGEWKPAKSGALQIDADAGARFTQRLKQGATAVDDFDDHLADVSRDWRNGSFAA